VILDDEREEVAKHLLGNVEVGDDAVLHRSHRDDAVGRPAQHPLRLETNTLDLLRLPVDRDDRRLVEDDALAFDVDKRIRCAEVDTDCIRGKERSRFEEGPAHPVVRSVVTRPVRRSDRTVVEGGRSRLR